jgi:hypothetical protein
MPVKAPPGPDSEPYYVPDLGEVMRESDSDIRAKILAKHAAEARRAELTNRELHPPGATTYDASFQEQFPREGMRESQNIEDKRYQTDDEYMQDVLDMIYEDQGKIDKMKTPPTPYIERYPSNAIGRLFLREAPWLQKMREGIDNAGNMPTPSYMQEEDYPKGFNPTRKNPRFPY